MEIEVRLYAEMRRYSPGHTQGYSDRLRIRPGATVAEAMDTLGIPEDLPAVIFVNGGSAERNTVLKAEDVLVVISPVQGG